MSKSRKTKCVRQILGVRVPDNRVTVRLRDDERAHLNAMAAGEFGTENVGEFIRLLLHREWNRRKKIGPPAAKDYQTAFRTGGRPVNGKSKLSRYIFEPKKNTT
jgi:hypothetical protein